MVVGGEKEEAKEFTRAENISKWLILLMYVPFSPHTSKCPGLYPWGYEYIRVGITAYFLFPPQISHL